MTKAIMLLALAVVGTGAAGLTGCKKAEPATPAAAAVKKVEQPAATQPAQQKPKDHPAH